MLDNHALTLKEANPLLFIVTYVEPKTQTQTKLKENFFTRGYGKYNESLL